MREKGVRVLTVREILAYGTADHVGARLELEEFAMQVQRACCGLPATALAFLKKLDMISGGKLLRLHNVRTALAIGISGADLQAGGGGGNGRH